MTPRVYELIDLIARWVHVIAAIMWVGNSMLFNWMDRTLVQEGGMPPGSIGTTWLLHSGAFYHVEKTSLGGHDLPAPLHWFKWQAYTTWLSGIVLMLAVYWIGGRAAMEDASRAPLSHGQAAALGAFLVFGGVAIYELIQRLVAPRAPRVAEALLALAFLGAVFAATGLLNGRAAFLHVGAMMASIMAGNVAMTIVPSQRELLKSVKTSGSADPVISARAKRVSIHNNYFTFPVIVLMVSGHFPSLYAGRAPWASLLVLVIAGATVRHILNVRFSFSAWRGALAGTLVVSVVALWMLMTLPLASTPLAASATTGEVSFTDARRIIDRRCAACHSMSPSDLTFGPAPAGVMFDTPEQIRSHMARIRERAVVTRTMPPANRTNITDAERAALGRWIDSGR
ncbi:MAG: urate hydroxylase PuuD [Gemmatimonadota bacterium]|nr:urate hydroxylase PuuD [Gemmatimonadota bacterium]